MPPSLPPEDNTVTTAKDREQYETITAKLESLAVSQAVILGNIEDFKELRKVTNQRLGSMTDAIQSVSDRVAVQNGRITKLEELQGKTSIDEAFRDGLVLVPKKVGWLLTQKAVWPIILAAAAGTIGGREIVVSILSILADLTTKGT